MPNDQVSTEAGQLQVTAFVIFVATGFGLAIGEDIWELTKAIADWNYVLTQAWKAITR